MRYAVIRTGGKQYKINEGDVIDVERLPAAADKSVTFAEVLMVTDGANVTLGAPLLSGVSVVGTVIDDIRGEKIRVAKYKSKVRYRRVTGHRQALTRVKIDSIVTGSTKKSEKAPAKEAKAAKVTASAPKE